MPETVQSSPILHPTGADRLESLYLELRRHLEQVKRELEEEIRMYPTPIPRCDAQFNHLYEQRVRLSRILNLRSGAGAEPDICVEAIVEFVGSPAFSESARERELRDRLRRELSHLPVVPATGLGGVAP